MQPSLFDPPTFVLADLPARIAAKIVVDPDTSCWLWIAVRQPDGYGKAKWSGRMVSVHRLSYQLLVGAIPDGLEIDHLCRVRNCVNPVHMEPVTHGENVRRTLGGIIRKGDGECRQGHDLAFVGVRPNGQCAECCRAATRRYVAKRRAELPTSRCA